MKSLLIFCTLLILLTVTDSFCWAVDPQLNQVAPSNFRRKLIERTFAIPDDLVLTGNVENGVRVVHVTASQFQFDPNKIVVQQGETVRIVVSSTDVDHGFAITSYNINLKIPAGKTVSTEFKADKNGIFVAYCNVYCGTGHNSMRAKFIVKPSPTKEQKTEASQSQHDYP